MKYKVVIGIINKDSKILMIKRVKQEGDLLWSFPSGKVEPGETKEEACIREVYEETGLNVTVKEELGIRKHPSNDIELTYFLCDYVSGEIEILNPSEVCSIEFKTKLEFERDVQIDVFEPVRQYIKKYIK